MTPTTSSTSGGGAAVPLFPWENIIINGGRSSSVVVRNGLATAGGQAAPTARTLKWAARSVSVKGQGQFVLGLPVIMSDEARLVI